MTTLTLTDNQTSTLRNAVVVAYERYRDNAKIVQARNPRLADQFTRQATEALDLIELIDGADGD